jgi:predicted GNAT family N-acyltransferase
MPVEVRAARPEEVGAALDLRVEVFCGEQGVPVDAERDDRDADAVHVVAVAGDDVVGTCRVLLDGDAARIGRMAVAARWRRRRVGARLLAEAERLAAAQGATRAELHAQTAAEAFYAGNGYRSAGRTFLEEGIEHVTMAKTLA